MRCWAPETAGGVQRRKKTRICFFFQLRKANKDVSDGKNSLITWPLGLLTITYNFEVVREIYKYVQNTSSKSKPVQNK